MLSPKPVNQGPHSAVSPELCAMSRYKHGRKRFPLLSYLQYFPSTKPPPPSGSLCSSAQPCFTWRPRVPFLGQSCLSPRLCAEVSAQCAPSCPVPWGHTGHLPLSSPQQDAGCPPSLPSASSCRPTVGLKQFPGYKEGVTLLPSRSSWAHVGQSKGSLRSEHRIRGGDQHTVRGST